MNDMFQRLARRVVVDTGEQFKNGQILFRTTTVVRVLPFLMARALVRVEMIDDVR